VLVAQAFSKLGTSYLVEAELGWALPVLKHHLAITLSGAFTAPEATGTQTDPRVTMSGGSYNWYVQQEELILGLSLVGRFPIGTRLMLYVGVGPRLFLLQTRTQGNAGTSAISLSLEQSTQVGVGVPLGVAVRIGPGQIFVEPELNVSALPHTTTGSTNTGSLAFTAGYRFLF
jgi:hypothetical protein